MLSVTVVGCICYLESLIINRFNCLILHLHRRGGREIRHQLRLSELFRGLRASYWAHGPSVEHWNCVHVLHVCKWQQGSGLDRHSFGSEARDQSETDGTGEHGFHGWRIWPRYVASSALHVGAEWNFYAKCAVLNGSVWFYSET